MAHRRKYLATVQSLLFYSPTPRRLRRPNHPNLFPLGFSSKRPLSKSPREETRPGRARQGRAGKKNTNCEFWPSLPGPAWSPLGPCWRPPKGPWGGAFPGVPPALPFSENGTCYRLPGCRRAGKRAGSTCARKVEDLSASPAL